MFPLKTKQKKKTMQRKKTTFRPRDTKLVMFNHFFFLAFQVNLFYCLLKGRSIKKKSQRHCRFIETRKNYYHDFLHFFFFEIQCTLDSSSHNSSSPRKFVTPFKRNETRFCMHWFFFSKANWIKSNMWFLCNRFFIMREKLKKKIFLVIRHNWLFAMEVKPWVTI